MFSRCRLTVAGLIPKATAISLLVLARETRLKILLSAVVSLEMSHIALFSVLITGTEAHPVRLLSSFSFGGISTSPF